MVGERAGGREGRGREARRIDGETEQRSDTRGRAGEAAAVWARTHRSEQVEQANATEGEAVRERERKGREEVCLFTWRLLCLTLHSPWELGGETRRKLSWSGGAKSCSLAPFFFPLCFCTRVNWTSLQRLHRKDWEIKINKSRTEEKEKWESCSGGSFTVNLLLVGKSWICFIFLR